MPFDTINRKLVRFSANLPDAQKLIIELAFPTFSTRKICEINSCFSNKIDPRSIRGFEPSILRVTKTGAGRIALSQHFVPASSLTDAKKPPLRVINREHPWNRNPREFAILASYVFHYGDPNTWVSYVPVPRSEHNFPQKSIVRSKVYK